MICWERVKKEESGQSLVEFGLVAPILLLLVVGIFKFGLVLNNWLVMTDATRSAARALAVARGVPNICPPAGPGIVCTSTTDPCVQTATNVKNSASDLNIANLTVIVTPNTCNNGVLAYNSDVIVQSQYPCDLTILGVNFVPSCALTSKMVDRIE
jgi:TadE-like protein